MMASFSSTLLLLLIPVIQLLTFCGAQLPNGLAGPICYNNGNYTSNSTYSKNLKNLLTNISSDTTNTYGFYNMSEGQGPEKVSVVALCRGDISTTGVCRACLRNATSDILVYCPYKKEAMIVYDNCFLRYSDQSILGVLDENVVFVMYNVNNATNVTQYNQGLSQLLHQLAEEAESGNSTLKSAMGDTMYMDFHRVYALVQCTPDLSQFNCRYCLDQIISQIPNSAVFNKIGGRILSPSCWLRFEVSPFFAVAPLSPPPLPLPLPPTSPLSPPPPLVSLGRNVGGKKGKTKRLVVSTVVPTVVCVLLICVCIFLTMRNRRKKIEGADAITSVDVESLKFELVTIKHATNDFSDSNRLGQGGFGSVYKGKLSDGREIAVKRLSKHSEQGDQEFKNEVLLMAKLQHRNLVRLFGFCLEGVERLLVYEFVPNASLDRFLFDCVKRAQLDWETRFKIIGGIARGVLYLHEDSRLRIIHRDLKASNILLDAEMHPKIADFGMARLFTVDQTQTDTSRIVGTYGYMAPEYILRGQVSVKSDVYSFGVLVLEILSGQKVSSFYEGENNVSDLINYAWKKWTEGTPFDIVDTTMTGASSDEVMRCIHIGLLCVQESVTARPTMASVVLMISSSSIVLPIPSQPAFLIHSNVETTQWASPHEPPSSEHAAISDTEQQGFST